MVQFVCRYATFTVFERSLSRWFALCSIWTRNSFGALHISGVRCVYALNRSWPTAISVDLWRSRCVHMCRFCKTAQINLPDTSAVWRVFICLCSCDEVSIDRTSERTGGKPIYLLLSNDCCWTWSINIYIPSIQYASISANPFVFVCVSAHLVPVCARHKRLLDVDGLCTSLCACSLHLCWAHEIAIDRALVPSLVRLSRLVGQRIVGGDCGCSAVQMIAERQKFFVWSE